MRPRTHAPSPQAVAAGLMANAPDAVRESYQRDRVFAMKLERPALFSILTPPSVRMEMIREEITRRRLAEQRYGLGLTYAQAFAATYGEEL